MEVVMTSQELRNYQMLGRVRDFGTAHRDLFPARSVAGKLFAAVAAAADELQQHETTESAGRGGEQEGVASKAAARASLRRQVSAIAKTARASEVPGLSLGKFRASLACGDERLLSQARTFLKEAKPFADTFVAHELPPDFLSQLRAAIEAFEQAMAARASGRNQRVGARASIEATMEAGLRAVRRLGDIVPNRLQDPSAVALWNGARRMERGPRTRNGAAAVAAEPSPSPSAVTPAPAA
jgi:hypothetical protein